MGAAEWIAVVAAAAAVVAAGVAIFQAIEARKARSGAEEAQNETSELLRRQVAAQEQLASVASRRNPWSTARNVSGKLYAITNSSGRPIALEALATTPEQARDLVTPRTPIPSVLQAGEQFRAIVLGRMGLSVTSLRLTWRFEDEDEQQHTNIGID
jgi:hypothetical protein